MKDCSKVLRYFFVGEELLEDAEVLVDFLLNNNTQSPQFLAVKKKIEEESFNPDVIHLSLTRFPRNLVLQSFVVQFKDALDEYKNLKNDNMHLLPRLKVSNRRFLVNSEIIDFRAMTYKPSLTIKKLKLLSNQLQIFLRSLVRSFFPENIVYNQMELTPDTVFVFEEELAQIELLSCSKIPLYKKRQLNLINGLRCFFDLPKLLAKSVRELNKFLQLSNIDLSEMSRIYLFLSYVSKKIRCRFGYNFGYYDNRFPIVVKNNHNEALLSMLAYCPEVNLIVYPHGFINNYRSYSFNATSIIPLDELGRRILETYDCKIEKKFKPKHYSELNPVDYLISDFVANVMSQKEIGFKFTGPTILSYNDILIENLLILTQLLELLVKQGFTIYFQSHPRNLDHLFIEHLSLDNNVHFGKIPDVVHERLSIVELGKVGTEIFRSAENSRYFLFVDNLFSDTNPVIKKLFLQRHIGNSGLICSISDLKKYLVE